VKTLVRLVATLGPVGYLPIAPATWASAVVVAVGWFIPPPAIGIAFAWLVAGTLAGFWICNEAEKSLGHDAHPIVFDELIGQSLALLWVPRTLPAFAAAFVLFRLFDIWKPLGAREIQRLPGGFGVMADDIVAGLVACGVFHAGIRLLGAFGAA